MCNSIIKKVINAGVELLKQVPSELLISSNQLQLSNKSIGQGITKKLPPVIRRSMCGIVCSLHLLTGEFGVVYKGQLTKWRGRSQPLTVAVKTVKGILT